MMREVHLRGLNKDIHLWQVQGFLDSAVTPKSIHLIDGDKDKTATFLVDQSQVPALLAPDFRIKLQKNGMSIFIPHSASANFAPSKTITIPAPISHSHKTVPSDSIDKPRNLYFTGLPKALTQDQFRLLAEKWGAVEHSMLLSVLDGMGRRRGFVIYDEHEVARKAMADLSGAKISGHIIDVSWAVVQRYSKTGPATHRDNTIPNRLHHPPQRQTMSEIEVELPPLGPSTVAGSRPASPPPKLFQPTVTSAAPAAKKSTGPTDKESASIAPAVVEPPAPAPSPDQVTQLQTMVANLSAAPPVINSKILLLENLPAVFTNDYSLGHLFKSWGEIKRCLLFPAMLTVPTPTGYIEFENVSSAQQCLEACHGLLLGGNVITVRFLNQHEAYALGWGPAPMPKIDDHLGDISMDSSGSSRTLWEGWSLEDTSPETSWEQVDKQTRVQSDGDKIKADFKNAITRMKNGIEL